MTAVWFYHLERSTLEATLPPLLEKCLARGWRAAVRGAIPERLQDLDERLWTYREESFLPHGLEGRDLPERQPIWIGGGSENANGARALFVLDGAEIADWPELERVFVIFDGRDPHAVAHARTVWRQQKERGAEVSYWTEDASGRWAQKA